MSSIELQKKKAKLFIDANIWDGEDRVTALNDSLVFTPADLQEFIFELIEFINESTSD